VQLNLNMKIISYIQEAFNELVHKVSWPSWNDLQSSAIVVMVASFIFAIVVFFMDISFQKMVEFIYGMFF
jgi:preprotein translocase subunit SecE